MKDQAEAVLKEVQTNKKTVTEPESLFSCVGFSLEGLQSLPGEVRRNFTLMRDLDQKSEDIKGEIVKDCKQYLQEVETFTDVERRKKLKKIMDNYSKLRTKGDEKVDLARQVYEMVDKHIRQLDSELACYEADHKRKTALEATLDGNVTDGPQMGRGRGQKRRKKGQLVNPGEESKKSRKKLKVQQDVPATTPFIPSYQGGPDVLDMPVDPNEPTYCLCRQVSYGEMIGCDNMDCPIEWFHFNCVGLTTKPKGHWYCPKCDSSNKKKK